MHNDRDEYGHLWIGRGAAGVAAAEGSPGADTSPEAMAAAEGADTSPEAMAAGVAAGEAPPAEAGDVGAAAVDKLREISDAATAQLTPTEREILAARFGITPQLNLPGVAQGRRAPIVELGWLGLDSRGGRLLAGEGAITSGAVAFGEVREIVVRPQRPFKGRYLWVHSSIARSFLIHAVRVGPMIAGVAPTPIPADIFAVNYDDLATLQIHEVEPGKVVQIDVRRVPGDMPDGDPARAWHGVPFHLPAAQVGMEVAIMVENIERKVFEPIRFLGAFLGETVR